MKPPIKVLIQFYCIVTELKRQQLFWYKIQKMKKWAFSGILLEGKLSGKLRI